MPAKNSDPRTILIVHEDGTETTVENIPANARITFGPVQPGGKDGYGSRENVLRIYTTANNQLGVFRRIAQFRDLSLKVTTTVLEEDTEAYAHDGPDGSSASRTTRRRRVRADL